MFRHQGPDEAAPLFNQSMGPLEPLTLAWADRRERELIIGLALKEGRQTMNLRTMPGAELLVLRRWNGQFAGWAGVDVRSNPEHPELFSQFVYPEFRGLGLGGLLEHVWWAVLDHVGCARGFMRMELATNDELYERRLAAGFYRVVTAEELGPRFVGACRKCELFGKACTRQVFLEVDVRKALAASTRSRGHLDITALPIRFLAGSSRLIGQLPTAKGEVAHAPEEDTEDTVQ